MNKTYCNECICWEEMPDEQPVTIGGLREKVRTSLDLHEQEGYCRFWPPSPSAFPTGEESKRNRFPRTRGSDFCFQGEKKPA